MNPRLTCHVPRQFLTDSPIDSLGQPGSPPADPISAPTPRAPPGPADDDDADADDAAAAAAPSARRYHYCSLPLATLPQGLASTLAALGALPAKHTESRGGLRRHTGKERPHAQRRTRDLLECLSTGGRRREGRKGGMDEDGERSGAMPPRP